MRAAGLVFTWSCLMGSLVGAGCSGSEPPPYAIDDRDSEREDGGSATPDAGVPPEDGGAGSSGSGGTGPDPGPDAGDAVTEGPVNPPLEKGWYTYYGALDSDDVAYGVGVDDEGNIYVSGQSDDPWEGPSGQAPLNPHEDAGTDRNIFALKLSPDGEYQWHTFYHLKNTREGVERDWSTMAVDGDGNMFLSGSTGVYMEEWSEPLWKTDHANEKTPIEFLLKLDKDGALQWYVMYGLIIESSDMAVDSQGNVFVVGVERETDTSNPLSWKGPDGQEALRVRANELADYFVMKVAADGTYQWHTFIGSQRSAFRPGIATDESGNVYMTGTSGEAFQGPRGEDPIYPFGAGINLGEILVMKFDPDGAYQWHSFFGSWEEERSEDLVVDSNGDIFVTGMSNRWTGPDGEASLLTDERRRNFFVLKLNSSGEYQWHTEYGGSLDDWGRDIAAYKGQDLYVAANTDVLWLEPGGGEPEFGWQDGEVDDVLLLSLNPQSGSFKWFGFFGSPAVDSVAGLATDPDGNQCLAITSLEVMATTELEGPLHEYSGSGADVLIIKNPGR